MIVNHLGESIRGDATLKQYVTHASKDITRPENKIFELEITWPEDSETQGRLKILQCIAIFYQAKHPCRTSLVNINFVKEEGEV